MPLLNVYNLGQLGVNVDKSPLHLEDNELTKSQNAVHNKQGAGGGLTNRFGLVKYNSIAAAGSILGAIGVPLLNQFSSSAATSIHTFYFARTAAAGWRKSTDTWTTGSNTSGTPAALRSSALPPASLFNTGANRHIGHPGCILNNRLYYAGNDYTAGTTDPTIRVFDGTIDKQVCSVPYNPDSGAGTHSQGIVTMVALNGTIYLATLDSGTTDATWRGRVFQLTPDTGTLLQIGPTVATGHIPYSLWFWLGRLWLGTARLTHTNIANIYWIRPNLDTAWTLDQTMPTNHFIVTQMATYRGELYVSTVAGGGGASGQVRKRTTLGVWSLSDVTTSIADDDGYYSVAEFNDRLYAGSTGAAQKVIRKFDGSTWTSNFTSATAGALNNAYVHNGRIYMSAGNTAGGSTDDLLSTADGVIWTSHTSALNGDEGQGVFVAIVT